MPSSRVSTSSRSNTVTLRGGSVKRPTTTRRTYAPSYRRRSYVPKLAIPRRMSSWSGPAVNRSKIDIPQYVIANHNAFHAKAEGVKVLSSYVSCNVTNGVHRSPT